jgi:two-component system CheB/CheR fusion protein
MAFVVIMHLSAGHGSNLSAILQHRTGMPVHRVEADTTPAPNTVYVLPPETELGIEKGRLQATAPSESDVSPTVIDTFFRALAADRGEHSAGIVLSGAGTDGTRGMEAITAAGGFTMAQRPEEAIYDGMPWSVVATGTVDVVAPAEQLAAELATFRPRGRSGFLPEDGTILGADGEGTETRRGMLRSVDEAMRTTNQAFEHKQAFNHEGTEPRRSDSTLHSLMEARRRAKHERKCAGSIVNTVREPLLVLDEGLRVQFANDSFYDTFGVSREGTTGRRIHELGEGQWDVPELRARLNTVLAEDAVIDDVELDQHFEEQGRRVVQLSARRIDEKERILVTLEDVTALRRATQRVRKERNFVDSVLDTVGALVVVLDTEGRIVRFNQECESVTGYAVDEVKGKHVVDLLVPPEERDPVRDLFADLRRGEAPLHHENHWQTQQGEPRLIRWSNTVLRNDRGEVEYVVGTGIDVTERRRLEREVIAASEEERRRIGEDLHDTLASHLAGAAMMADGIADKLADETPGAAEEVRKVASLTREAGEQARSLSHSLLPLEVKDGTLMDGLQKMAERQEQMRAVVCSFEWGEEVPSVTGDVASHLYRIASEAVHNAVTHADPDTVAIGLDTEGDRLVLDVRDDGVGISEHVEPTDGVGIHVMQYRAHLIGAHLDVEPAEDGGTLVRCRLPLETVS